MTMVIDGSNGLKFPDNTNQQTAIGYNRIINGAMMIDQRNAGASVTNAVSGGAYVLDRWNYIATQASKFTLQQNAGSVTPPAGFTNYFGITSSSAYSIVSSDYFGINQQVEGFNSADLAWGTASAASVTLSFWVRSSLTGTFGGSISNNAFNRSYPFTYTISSANTWEQKTITIAGDTSGTWVGATNGIGIRVYLGIGVGSTYAGTAGSWSGNGYFSATGATSVVGTSGATFYITGVQLEKGSTATSFDYRPYGTELALCQRYYEKSFPIDVAPANGGASTFSTDAGLQVGVAINNSYGGLFIPFRVTKRIGGGTFTSFGNSNGHWGYTSSTAALTFSSGTLGSPSSNDRGVWASQQVVNNAFILIVGHWTYSAEL